jgi:putative transposase
MGSARRSSPKLAKTRMAKSVLDAGQGMLKTQLQFKGQQAGGCVSMVREQYTSRACSPCGALTAPAGVNGLRVSLGAVRVVTRTIAT